ncbi:hypothetical protein EVAR_19750_1 [Eumeta japonica]|uniref:Uncharacterized protein n=1 Tax=Eumeta variegata TaxID=151549 RepID=A0A4C1UQW4_EUMVA|nr:hypothetical protein EVAR_19750_1 [Eumeta japonica]
MAFIKLTTHANDRSGDKEPLHGSGSATRRCLCSAPAQRQCRQRRRIGDDGRQHQPPPGRRRLLKLKASSSDCEKAYRNNGIEKIPRHNNRSLVKSRYIFSLRGHDVPTSSGQKVTVARGEMSQKAADRRRAVVGSRAPSLLAR